MMNQSNPGASLLNYFEERQSEILEFTRSLVEQESMSREADALRRLADSLASTLAGIGAEIDLFHDSRCGTTVRARFVTQIDSEKQLLVIGHLDTVWPLGTLQSRPFHVEDGLAYGPGVFDMKAGVAIAAFAVKALMELGRSPSRPVTLLMTCDEETGSVFSRELIEAEGGKSKAALVIEPPIPGGKVKTGRKGVGEFQLVVRGKPAHA